MVNGETSVSAGESDADRLARARRAGGLAVDCMHRGNAARERGTEDGRREALEAFGGAIQLLSEAICDAGAVEKELAVELRVRLGAAWLNRGAVWLSGTSDDDAASGDAIRCFERAISELSAVEAAHPAARRNLASAWANLGLARGEKDAGGAVVAHERALSVAAAQPAVCGANDLAAMRLNLARARRAVGDAAGAVALGREVAAEMAAREREDAVAAQLGLRARQVVCAALAERWAREGKAPARDEENNERAEVARWIEAGLALERCHVERPDWDPEPARRLFELGVWLRGGESVAALAEFLRRHAQVGGPVRMASATAAVARARQEILQRGFTRLLGEEAERVAGELVILRELEAGWSLVAGAKTEAD